MSNLANQQAKDLRCYVTAAGFNVEANAKELNQTVDIKWIQLGGGELPAELSPVNQTGLVSSYGEQGKFPAKVYADPKNPGGFVAECTIGAEHAIDGKGYVINEAAAVLDSGVMYSYRRIASDYKPVNQGEAKSYIIRLRFVPANTEVINITVDPAVVFATQDDLIRVLGNHKDESDPHDQYLKHFGSDLTQIGRSVVNVFSFEHSSSVTADDFVLVKTSAKFGEVRHFMLDIFGGHIGYCAPFSAKLSWYYWGGQLYRPSLLIESMASIPIEVFIGNDNGYYAFAIKATYYQNFRVNLLNRKSAGLNIDELKGWSGRIVNRSALAEFTAPETVRTFNKNYPPSVEQITGSQLAPWDVNRQYKCGELVTVLVNDSFTVMECYHPDGCKGRDPTDPANRYPGWTDTTSPFYWTPYTPDTIIGKPQWHLAEAADEGYIMEMGQDLPIAVFWRLAARLPHLVNGNFINTGDIRGEYLRVWDGGRGVDAGRAINSHQDSTRLPLTTVFKNPDGVSGLLLTPPINTYPNGDVLPTDYEDVINGGGQYLTTPLSAGGVGVFSSYRVRVRNLARAMAIPY